MDLTFTPLDPAAHDELLHGWLTTDRARFWGMTAHSPAQVRAYLERVDASADEQGWIGSRDGTPLVYVETYDPARLLPAGLLDPEPGDLGMHLLIAPPAGEPEHGLTAAVIGEVVSWCLHERGAARLVVEPDARNRAVLAKNAAAGFRVLRHVEIPDGEGTKHAALSVCTRADFAASPLGPGATPTAHLRPDIAEQAHRHLIAKALAELSHERVLAPEPRGEGAWELAVPGTDIRYRFTARVLPLEHWLVDPASITRVEDGTPTPRDVQVLVAELQDLLGIPDDLLATYLEELASTLAARCATLDAASRGERPSAEELLDADLPRIEAAMTEGHPGFLANNGRIGFSLPDYRAFAPEQGRTTRLEWVAVRREHGHLALGEGLTEEDHAAWSLSAEERAAFAARLTDRGLDPTGYPLMPLHPWQAGHRLPITFAPDIARGDLVPLGVGGDEMQPQQSLRTFYNRTREGAPYVKVALAIQNMGLLRGLSPHYMRDTPAINDWLAALVAGDAEFSDQGFRVLRERAAIGYTGDAYHRTRTTNPHRKMLAALWRENPVAQLAPGERAFTMAALLHRDHEGRSVAATMQRASGLPPEQWLAGYLRAYLRSLVHLLLAHDVVVMPHGENLILRVREQQVIGAFYKDIGEEMAVVGHRPLPEDMERVRAVVPGEEKTLSIFTDVFDGVLRHLAGILDADGILPADRFWGQVASVLDEYESGHPDLARGLAGDVDLRAGSFAHSCLNRLQLRNTLQMVDLGDQASSLLYAGRMDNPVARIGAPV
ncbi:GNAT family N-acetyltransferase [Brachybacterium sp. GU-2]|uniref:GNAT family N-acetyltransferase n=1 Tax=Brachybacterium sp. GU-2 TaxID=3069708 RepID=UPI00280B6A90|nr:GNAT family N-acetyltransferase [Brachybacterium sp. GU-2]WME24623.1 GNAT family N-acetyltransferase [Brachybacterium sp. GU-2]